MTKMKKKESAAVLVSSLSVESSPYVYFVYTTPGWEVSCGLASFPSRYLRSVYLKRYLSWLPDPPKPPGILSTPNVLWILYGASLSWSAYDLFGLSSEEDEQGASVTKASEGVTNNVLDILLQDLRAADSQRSGG